LIDLPIGPYTLPLVLTEANTIDVIAKAQTEFLLQREG
jgi:hypothetical protein